MGIDAINIEVPGVGHNGIVRTSEFTTSISQIGYPIRSRRDNMLGWSRM